MTALDDWVDQVSAALGLAPTDASVVLDLARDVAHGVMRPAAPVTAYLLGIAVGQGADPKGAASVISGLAETWSASRAAASPPDPAPSA